MSITGANNPFSCTPVVFSAANQILQLGTITRDGNVFTFSVGFVWKINGVTYQNTAPVVLTIAEASEGFFRIDNAILNTSNSIELQQGLESETIALQPVVPDTNILLTSWNVSGATINDQESPIVGTQFRKKTELQSVVSTISGENAQLPFISSGASVYSLQNSSLVSISGFSRNLLTGATNEEPPYEGKEFWIYNNTANAVTLLYDAQPTDAFSISTGEDLEIPSGGKVMLKFQSGFFTEIFKSWGATVDLSGKLDKVTTTGVERVYTINPDGTQGTKAVSDLGGGATLQDVLINGNTTDRNITIVGEVNQGNNISLDVANEIPKISLVRENNIETNFGELQTSLFAGRISMIREFDEVLEKEALLTPNSLTMIDYSIIGLLGGSARMLNVTSSGIFCNQYNTPNSPLDYIQREFVDQLFLSLPKVKKSLPQSEVTTITSQVLVYESEYSKDILNQRNILDLDFTFIKLGNNGTCRWRFFLQEGDNLSTRTSVATYDFQTTSQFAKFKRTIEFKNDMVTCFRSDTINQANDYGLNTGFTSFNFNTTSENNIKIIVTVQLNNGQDTAILKNVIETLY
jgi:hypothetical protein